MTGEVDRTALDELLRSCVECGLCLPSCATYLATGNEIHSPRGRLLLLGDVLDERLDPDLPEVKDAFGHCLGCLACTATCPSGVSADLLDVFRRLGAAPESGRRRRLIALLDRRASQRVLRRAAAVSRWLAVRLFGASWRRRLDDSPRLGANLARMLGTVPAGPGPDAALVRLLDGRVRQGSLPAPGGQPGRRPRTRRVGFFRGCADQQLLPDTARRLRETLADLGCDLVEPAGQDCCGALASHLDSTARAAKLQRRNRAAFAPHLATCECVVVAAAGCGRELAIQGDDLAGKVVDAATLLEDLAPDDLGPVRLRVAIHDPCHARHGLGVVDAPRRLLRSIPDLELLEPDEAEVCCGSAGVYGVRRPQLAAVMGRRKAEILAATGCDIVVTTNPGCLGQIADGLALVAPDVPIVPLSDLIWYARRRGRRDEEKA